MNNIYVGIVMDGDDDAFFLAERIQETLRGGGGPHSCVHARKESRHHRPHD